MQIIVANVTLTFTPFQLELLRRGLTVASDDGAYSDSESEVVAELLENLDPVRERI